MFTGITDKQPHQVLTLESPLFELADGIICLRYIESPEMIQKKIYVFKTSGMLS